MGLIEESFTESGSLVQIGVDCIWQLLDLQLTPPRVQLCRMLAGASLAHNLVRALGSVTREYASLSNQAAVSLRTCGLHGAQASQQLALSALNGRVTTMIRLSPQVANHVVMQSVTRINKMPTVPVYYPAKSQQRIGLKCLPASLTSLCSMQHQGVYLPHLRLSLLP